jgi:hypothetical protein
MAGIETGVFSSLRMRLFSQADQTANWSLVFVVTALDSSFLIYTSLLISTLSSNPFATTSLADDWFGAGIPIYWERILVVALALVWAITPVASIGLAIAALRHIRGSLHPKRVGVTSGIAAILSLALLLPAAGLVAQLIPSIVASTP